MSTATPEPWLDSEAARKIAPLEFVADLSPEGRRRLATQVFLWGRLRRTWTVVWYAGLVGLGVALLLTQVWPVAAIVCVGLSCLGLFMGWMRSDEAAQIQMRHEQMLSSRLLAGFRGFALWGPAGSFIQAWEHVTAALLLPAGDQARKLEVSSLRETFFLQEVYEHANRVEERVRAELKRRESTRDEPAGPPHPLEPWLDSDAAREIGPVEFVAQPRPDIAQQRRQAERLRTRLFVFLLLGPIVNFLISLYSPNPWLDPALVFEGGVVLIFLLIYLTPDLAGDAWLLDTRILVGARGLALWWPGGATVVPWEELGTFWEAHTTVPSGESTGAVARTLLRLRRTDRTCLHVTDLYEDAGRIQDRVLAELRRQADRSRTVAELPALTPGADVPDGAVPAGPWRDSEAARVIGPLLLAAGTARPARRRWLLTVYAWTALGCVVFAAFAGLTTLALFDLFREQRDGPNNLAVFLALAIGALAWTYFYWRSNTRFLRDRLLLGRRGLALWRPDGEIVVLWAALGHDWRPSAEVAPPERSLPLFRVLLRLQHTDGSWVSVRELDEHAAQIVEHVRAELQRRTDTRFTVRLPETGPSDITPDLL